MNQVLILTKNILAEQEIQQKLQALNYEVYCSVNVFVQCNKQQEPLEFFNYFQYVILSETICESEVMEIIQRLKGHSIRILRKVETKVTEMDHEYLEKERLHAIISTDDSMDELRECLYALKRKIESTEDANKRDNIIQLSGKVSMIHSNVMQKKSLSPEKKYKILEVLHRLSQTETRILTILIEAGPEVVTRETICQKIWFDEVNKSHLASLSSTITRIKNKFEQAGIEKKAIYTLWGKGYCINQDLLEVIQQSEFKDGLVLNEQVLGY